MKDTQKAENKQRTSKTLLQTVIQLHESAFDEHIGGKRHAACLHLHLCVDSFFVDVQSMHAAVVNCKHLVVRWATVWFAIARVSDVISAADVEMRESALIWHLILILRIRARDNKRLSKR